MENILKAGFSVWAECALTCTICLFELYHIIHLVIFVMTAFHLIAQHFAVLNVLYEG